MNLSSDNFILYVPFNSFIFYMYLLKILKTKNKKYCIVTPVDHTNTADLAEVLVLLTTAEGRLNVFYNLTT